jgi:cytochrome c2
MPREVVPMDKGILLRFDNPVDAKRASDPHNYTIASWHYRRSYTYGSPQLRANDTPGSDRLVPSSAYVSKDGKGVFVGVPDMTPVMQMHIGWTLATTTGTVFQDSASFTPYELATFTPEAEGFGPITVNLSPKTEVATVAGPVSIAEGRKVYERYGCVACHANETDAVSRLGPNFKGLFGSERIISQGAVRVVADEPYIRESILEPTKKVVTGFNRTGMGMPSFAGVLTEQQLESLVLYIKSLK